MPGPDARAGGGKRTTSGLGRTGEARHYAEAILATMRQPLIVLDGDLRVEMANRAFYRTFEVSQSETEGRLVYELGNRQWDIPELRELLEDVLPKNGTAEDFRVEHEFERVGRRVMILNAHRMESAGRPDTILLAIEDATERERERWELEGQKEYAEKVVDAARDALLILDWNLRVRTANETFYETFKVDARGTESRLIWELGNRQWDIPRLRELLENVLPDNDAFDDYEVEHDFEGIGHRIMVLNARRIDHMQLILLAIEDQTESRRAARALAVSAAKFRVLVETAAEAVWETGPDGAFLEDSPTWRDFTGQPLEGGIAEGWLGAVHPDDREWAARRWHESISSGMPFESELRIRRADGGWCWCDVRAAPVRDPDGRIERWVAMTSDIGRRKSAEEERELLLGELNHRVKNLFGVIRALAVQGDGGPEVKEYKRVFAGRLDALVRAHTLALEKDWRGVDLASLAARTLEPYAIGHPEAIAIEGEPVQLDPRRALSLGLTLHELSTNSVKYGALSTHAGRVRLSWRVVRAAPGPRAEITWEEHGGPAVRPPERRGFGTVLIERVFTYDLRGGAELDFRREGLRVEAWLPLP